DPSGKNEMIDADIGSVGVQWSQGAEMPTCSRPSGPRVMPFVSPRPPGSGTIVVLEANATPSNPAYAVIEPVAATKSVPCDQVIPSGVCSPLTTLVGIAPAELIREM